MSKRACQYGGENYFLKALFNVKVGNSEKAKKRYARAHRFFA